MKIHVSVIFKVIDGYKKLPVSRQSVTFYINGNRVQPIYKEGGYFVFTNLETAHFKFSIKSYYYQSQDIEFEYEEHITYPVQNIFLMPNRQYPLLSTDRMVYLKAKFEEKQVKGQKIYVVNKKKEYFKVAKDQIKAEETEVKLLLNQDYVRQQIAGKYLIRDKDIKKSEICTVLSEEGEKNLYRLESPLRYSHVRGTPFFEIMESYIEENGIMDTVVRNHHEQILSEIEAFIEDEGTLEQIEIEFA